jgi:hypothetical protein
MSESGSRGTSVLNWRGPLLAGAIFATVFAVLLLMARQNESNTSDPGSSFRQDPYGTSLLFDTYQRAGYHVERSQDESSLADQNAAGTTAFFIGGEYSDDDAAQAVAPNALLQGRTKFRACLEDFLARGGRVVLIESSDATPLKSSSQGWEVGTQWRKGSHYSGPAWAAPQSGAMPDGSEAMYLFSDSPWLKTDAHWTTLYATPENAAGGQTADTAANGGEGSHVYMATRPAGKGEVVVASQESFLLNETIKTHPNPVLLSFLAGGRSSIWVDETLHGLQQDEGVLWLVQRYRLQAALLLFWSTLLALLWSMSGDLVRRPGRDRSEEIVRHAEHAGVAGERLLRRSIAKDQVVAECWDQFRRRSPLDAQAIASDPQRAQRLRSASSLSPLQGYKQLRDLIAERRAAARTLAHAIGGANKGSSELTKKSSEEASTA